MVASLPVGLAALAAAVAALLILPAASLVVVAVIRIGPAGAVGGGERDLDLVQLVPLGIGAVFFGNRAQFLQAALGGGRLWWLLGFVHTDILVQDRTKAAKQLLER